MRLGFTIEYTNSGKNLRHCDSDFVAVGDWGMHFVIETKEQGNIDVAYQGRGAAIWFENATLLADVTSTYLEISEVKFGKLQRNAWSDAQVVFASIGHDSL